MVSLFFTCPTTLQQAPTGIETEIESRSPHRCYARALR
jgi:hypothetical protein